MTSYVVTRWYRAPEIILECHVRKSDEFRIMAKLLMFGHVVAYCLRLSEEDLS